MEKKITGQARELTGTEATMVEDALILARAKRPYYSVALGTLRPYAVDGLGTVGVDKNWNLYVDPEWFEKQEPDWRANMIAGHEVEHLLRRHPARHEQSKADADAWNVAADCEINDDCGLKWNDDYRWMPKKLGAEDGLTAEEYMRFIDEMPKGGHDCGSGAGGKPRGYEVPGAAGTGEDMGQESEQAIRDATAAAVMAHVKANGRGSVPAGVLMWAEAEAKGKLPPSWDRQFSNLFGKLSRELRANRADYSYSRLHRRTRPGAVVKPANMAPLLTVGLVVDTSGSMGGEGAKVLATVKQVMRKYQTLIIDCDAEVHGVRKGKKGNVKFTGGGDTDLRPAIELAQKRADAIVIVTDCDTPWPSKVTKPAVVVATGTSSAPDWAKVVRIQP